MSRLTLVSMRLKNFKAIRDSGNVTFTPLTAFIGNNGSGKSSLIEGLQTYQQVLMNGLDIAMQHWRGFERIHNPPLLLSDNGHRPRRKIAPIEFELSGTLDFPNDPYHLLMTISRKVKGDEITIESEGLDIDGTKLLQRNQSGETQYKYETTWNPLSLGLSMLAPAVLPRYDQIYEQSFVSKTVRQIVNWQFLTLNPLTMGNPIPQNRSGGHIRLEPDGSNVANYLLDIGKRDQTTLDSIVETLRYVLPYADNIQPMLTTELDRDVYLQLTEGQTQIPGWLLSTGTLRILALLAVLKHPEPPPLIVIEEIENGLDPRTINLIVEEMRSLTESGRSQIIITTHSPYLLNLLTLSQVVVVERNATGEPEFSRPGDQETLKEWAKRFSPGDLYTMGKLSAESR